MLRIKKTNPPRLISGRLWTAMKSKFALIILLFLLLSVAAYAGTDYFRQYSVFRSQEAQDAALNADIPPNILSQEEQALFRLGFAYGYDYAMETGITLRSMPDEPTYIVNLATKKFHKPDCYMVNAILFENREDLYCTYWEAIQKGYSPCRKCFKDATD